MFGRSEAILLCVLSVGLHGPAASAENHLHQKTREAQERIRLWEEEEKRMERRERWETGLAIALFIIGAAFASKNNEIGYAATFSAAAGLTVHIWKGGGGGTGAR